MRVFVTGATGFIGSAVVEELIGAGHKVVGLARSDQGASSLEAAGAQVHRGDIENLESLRRAADKADGVIHLAFNHDFSRWAENCETDRRVVEALGSALAGSDRLLIVTSGTAMAHAKPGDVSTENDPTVGSEVIPRGATEEAAAAIASQGVRVGVVRLPQVHDTTKQGLVTYAVEMAREKGVSAFIGDGMNRWPAAHRLDTARLYRLALEKTDTSSIYHAVAEEGVPMRDIAEAIGRGLKVPAISIAPEKAGEHFGWLGHFAGWDMPSSSAQTRKKLGWNPTGPGMIVDLNNMRYL